MNESSIHSVWRYTSTPYDWKEMNEAVLNLERDVVGVKPHIIVPLATFGPLVEPHKSSLSTRVLEKSSSSCLWK